MLKDRLQKDQIAAMKAGEKEHVAVIRQIMAAIKQVEVDSRKELSDQDVITQLTKMVKQRKDSFSQYKNAGRDDLANKEAYEIEVINAYLPQQLSEDEITQAIDNILSSSGTLSIQDMGKIMGKVKTELQGRADLGLASKIVREKLSAK